MAGGVRLQKPQRAQLHELFFVCKLASKLIFVGEAKTLNTQMGGKVMCRQQSKLFLRIVIDGSKRII